MTGLARPCGARAGDSVRDVCRPSRPSDKRVSICFARGKDKEGEGDAPSTFPRARQNPGVIHARHAHFWPAQS